MFRVTKEMGIVVQVWCVLLIQSSLYFELFV